MGNNGSVDGHFVTLEMFLKLRLKSDLQSDWSKEPISSSQSVNRLPSG